MGIFLRAKEGKLLFQITATPISSPRHFTYMLFHLVFSTTLKDVYFNSHFEGQMNFPSRGASLFTLKPCSLPFTSLPL